MSAAPLRFALPVALATVALLQGCSGTGISGSSHEVASAEAIAEAGEDYRLQGGDKVRVSVYGEADLSGEVTIGENGTADLPLVGGIEASGLTADQFRDAIAARLADGYLTDPKVGVEILSFPPVLVQGEVKTGGPVPYRKGIAVQDAVATVGGYTYRANERYVFLRKAGADVEYKVRLDRRVVLGPGDSVRVPERYF